MVSRQASNETSRWTFVLFFAWALSSAWVITELVRGVPFERDEVAIPALVLLVASAVIGSRIFLFLQERVRQRRSPKPRARSSNTGDLDPFAEKPVRPS